MSTLLPLFLASQTAFAKDCAPLFIDIFVSPIPYDSLVEEFYEANVEQREIFHDRYLLPVEEFFQREVGVPVSIQMYPAHTEVPLERHIPVDYTTVERFLDKEFPNREAFYAFAEQRGVSEKKLQKWEEKLWKKYPDATDKDIVHKAIRSTLDISLGFANPYEQRAYIFSNPILTSLLYELHDIDESQGSIFGGILVHELGHVFGVEHSRKYSTHGKANVMYAGDRWMDIPAFINDTYTFLPNDKELLREDVWQ